MQAAWIFGPWLKRQKKDGSTLCGELANGYEAPGFHGRNQSAGV